MNVRIATRVGGWLFKRVVAPGGLLATLAGLVLLLGGATPAGASLLIVPDDQATIQAALDAALAGDTIEVRQQVYHEKIAFPRSGNAVDGYITLKAFPGDEPVLDGTGVSGSNMVLIEDRSYVKLIGFEIRNDLGVNDGSGVRFLGSGSNIEIRDNEIHDIRGQHAMGITVYGTGATPISNLIIDGNEIHDCEPFRSEALTLNGNVTDFQVTNNVVRDVNNIGIDFIGGESDIQPDSSKVARNGVCRGNTVLRAREQGGGYAGGIYVDGGRDIVIENNTVSGCDLGIEIGAENSGIVASGVIVRDNLVFANEKAGIVFGGYKSSVGRTKSCQFLNNTCYENDTLGEGLGELWIQYAEDNQIRNNVFYSTSQNVLLYSEAGNVNNTLDYNLWYTEAGAGSAEFVWQGTSYGSFAAYRAATGQDASSLFADPAFSDAAAGDFHLQGTSPAINAGDPAFVPGAGEVDLDGTPRVNGARVDLGADEATVCGDGSMDPGEECDDGNLVDGDGCDSNCTVTACGNGIATAGEQCDDGNTSGGDCCSAACQFEGAGSACDDADVCTSADACDGAGACAGSAAPAPVCRMPTGSGKSLLLLKDKSNDKSDLLLWKWTRGEATTPAEFADPTVATTYTLCVYDASAAVQPLVEARAQVGGEWKLSGSGYRYRDRARSPDGLLSIKLKPGAAGKALVKVKGKGSNLALPALGLASPVVVQLRRSGGGCWGATFSSPSRNDASQFKAKSD